MNFFGPLEMASLRNEEIVLKLLRLMTGIFFLVACRCKDFMHAHNKRDDLKGFLTFEQEQILGPTWFTFGIAGKEDIDNEYSSLGKYLLMDKSFNFFQPYMCNLLGYKLKTFTLF